ncbi:ATP-binding cassette subfamily C protein LapB [Sinorhizobium kostiense]|uniref:ATP-binding cassette subfamily C protein LapB n=1 Tax=Sinorhizobium kostiense TaxID=76747 RepID=A0ABS4QS90_9HYPH|nr:type I secretion system permease/ATPase [Sinorhizobium kostiense]MBP2233515.1 ATP-binding cassette subfamily C protein LapB [Sinorhizobium kostiense]
MQGVETQARPGPALTGFTTAFKEICIFLNRPSSETVLFSDVPFDAASPSFEDISRIAERVGLEAELVSLRALANRSFFFPLLLVFKDGRAVAILEEGPGGALTFSNASFQDGVAIRLADLRLDDIAYAVAFSATYLNTAAVPAVGEAHEIDRRHWLTSAVRPFWQAYAQVALAAFFINVLALATPLFTMNVYDRILPNKAISTLWVLAIGIGFAIFFDFLLKTVRAALIDYAGRKADLKLSYLLFEKILHATLASRPQSTGEYANRVMQFEFVREFFTSNTVSTLIDSLFAFVFIAAVYAVAGWIAIVPTVAFLLSVFVGYVAQRKIGNRVAAASNESAQRQSLLVETIGAIETVKTLHSEKLLLRRWNELGKHSSNTSEQIKQVSSWASHATQFVQQLVTVCIVVAGAYEFAQGNISSGAIIAASMLAGRAVAPLGQIALTLARLRQALLSLKILNSIMEQPEDRPNTVGFVNRDIRQGSLTFANVDFAYPGSDHKVIHGMSMTIKAGERVGIIGRIGSGKTTIGRLLAGLYPPSAGRILLDGVDIRQFHPSVVRSAVSFVSQSSDLFSGTVKDNLLMANPMASDEEMVAAAKLAGVDDFVSHHPRGYDMPVGERGSQLSGGQRQAVAIARLLLRKPKIVFLDEPSGALDMASERELINRLSTVFGRDVTVLISTHRHSMLQLVDRLLVLDRGRIVADGPKAQVIDQLQKRSGAINPSPGASS